MTEETYFWLSEHRFEHGCRIWGVKGAVSDLEGFIHIPKEPLTHAPSGRALKGGLVLIHLDTIKLKQMFHERLGRAVNGGSRQAFLHAETGEDYFHQVLSEELRMEKGRLVYKRLHENHLLDCEMINTALAERSWPAAQLPAVKPYHVDQNRGPSTRPGEPGNPGVRIGDASLRFASGGMDGAGCHSSLNGRTMNPNHGRRLL
jgi:phage terminase large subunit GpA-like protein